MSAKPSQANGQAISYDIEIARWLFDRSRIAPPVQEVKWRIEKSSPSQVPERVLDILDGQTIPDRVAIMAHLLPLVKAGETPKEHSWICYIAAGCLTVHLRPLPTKEQDAQDIKAHAKGAASEREKMGRIFGGIVQQNFRRMMERVYPNSIRITDAEALLSNVEIENTLSNADAPISGALTGRSASCG